MVWSYICKCGLMTIALLSTPLTLIIEPIQCSSGFVTRFSPPLSVPAKAQNLTPQNICGHHATFPIHADIASENLPGRKGETSHIKVCEAYKYFPKKTQSRNCCQIVFYQLLNSGSECLYKMILKKCVNIPKNMFSLQYGIMNVD